MKYPPEMCTLEYLPVRGKLERENKEKKINTHFCLKATNVVTEHIVNYISLLKKHRGYFDLFHMGIDGIGYQGYI